MATLEELQPAINKHIETGTTMELLLVNKFTLGADESTSISEMSELSISIKSVFKIYQLQEPWLCSCVCSSVTKVSSFKRIEFSFAAAVEKNFSTTNKCYRRDSASIRESKNTEHSESKHKPVVEPWKLY